MGNPPSRSGLLNEDKGGPARSHRRSVRWPALTLALAGVLLLAAGQAAHAATFTVTKTADTNDGTCDADCSLREAIVAANAAAGPDTITFTNLANVTRPLYADDYRDRRGCLRHRGPRHPGRPDHPGKRRVRDRHPGRTRRPGAESTASSTCSSPFRRLRQRDDSARACPDRVLSHRRRHPDLSSSESAPASRSRTPRSPTTTPSRLRDTGRASCRGFERRSPSPTAPSPTTSLEIYGGGIYCCVCSST